MSTLRSIEMVEIGLEKAKKYVAELQPWLSNPRLKDLKPFLPHQKPAKTKAQKATKKAVAVSDDL